MKKYGILIGILLLCLCLVSCGKDTVSDPDVLTGEQETNYIYEDTAILVTMDKEAQSATFQNVETGLRYTLSYDGVTYFNDKYGSAMSAQQVKCGVIADVSFHKLEKKLLTFDVSSDYFVYSDITFEEFSKMDTRFTFLDEEYKLDDFLVISDGNTDLDKMELSKDDIISVCGKDHTIYSIYLQKGHGYLRLDNDEYFVGGWIEVGNKIIREISEDMLLTVPEGSYEVLVSNDGIIGIKQATIGRNQEVTLDLGDIDVEKKYGNVLFVLNPSDAELFIDGAKVDTGGPVSMEYGIHQLICRADGYDTMSSYIKVGEPSASVTLTLTESDTKEEDSEEEDSEEKSESENNSEKESESASESDKDTTESQSESSSDDDSKDTSESESSSENSEEKDSEESSSDEDAGNSSGSSSGTASTEAKVYVDGPEGTEVYADGSYVGIAPISFQKTEGSIVITLRKNGYQTRSYTIQLEKDGKDVHYSFSDLIEIGS